MHMRLICSACDDEIRFLTKTNLGDSLICSLGIGYLDAALNLEKLIQSHTITEIVFIGTAGSYTNLLEIGELVSVSSSFALNLGALLGFAYVPAKQESFNLEAFKDFKSAQCFSSLEISQQEIIAEKLISQNQSEKYLVENMELYGVAAVAKRHGIPLKALLGITNYINHNAHEDWKANNLEVSEKLCVIARNEMTKQSTC